jgi:hypothetical protein
MNRTARRAADSDRQQQLEAAAAALQTDYAVDEELTAFTILDGQDFRASR